MTQLPQNDESLSTTDTSADALRKVVAPALASLRRAEVVARADADPEGAHQIRVATRRLRSGLKAFGRDIEGLDAKSLRRDLRWLGRGMGSLRDIDVQLARLPELLPPALPKRAFEALQGALRERRHAAMKEALSTLDSPRYRRLISRLAAIVVAKGKESDGSALEQARKALGRQHGRLVADIDEGVDTTEALHRVRLKIKQLRYLIEMVAPIAGKPGRRLLQEFAQAQKHLGEFHDAAVSLQWAQQWEGLGTLPEAPLAKIKTALVTDAERSARRAAKAARRLCTPAMAKRAEAVRAKLRP